MTFQMDDDLKIHVPASQVRLVETPVGMAPNDQRLQHYPAIRVKQVPADPQGYPSILQLNVR